MGIQHKLLSGYVIIAIVAAIVAFFSMRATQILDSAFEQVSGETLPIVDVLHDLRYFGALMVANTSELALALAMIEPDQRKRIIAEERSEITIAKAKYGNALDRYRHLTDKRRVQNDAHILDLITYSSEKLEKLLDEIVELQQQKAPASRSLAKMETAEGYEMSLLITIDAALAGEVERFTMHKEDISRSIRYTRNTTAGFGPLSILVAILIAIFSSRRLVKTVIALKNASLAMAAGNLNVRVPRLSRDEFGDLARSFNDMALSLKEKGNELNAARAYLDEIIHTTADLIIITDPDNLIRTVDQAVLDLAGYEENELLGKNIAMLFGPDTRTRVTGKWLPKLKDGVPIRHAEITFLDRTGTETPATVSACVVRDQKSIIHGFIYIGHSATLPAGATDQTQVNS